MFFYFWLGGENTRVTMLSKHLNKLYSIPFIFLLSFLFQLVFIFQGCDVTDTGFHLTHQVASFLEKVDQCEISPMIFLTDFCGGAWLSLPGRPSLLWARLGGILLYSLNTAIIFSILSSYFELEKAFLVTFISSLFTTMRLGIDIIDYYTFPAFLLTVQIWLFHKLLISSKESHRKTYGFFIGFITATIILSKWPLFFVMITPVLMTAYYMLTQKNLTKPLRIIMQSSVGFICSIIIFKIVYQKLGLLDIFPFSYAPWNTILKYLGTGHHNANLLFNAYVTDYVKVIRYSFFVFIGLHILSVLGDRIHHSYAKLSVIVLPILFVCFIATYKQDVDTTAYNIIFSTVGVLTIFAIMFISLDKGENIRLDLLLIAGVVQMFITPLGSATGLMKSFYGMWLVLPLSLLCMEKIKDRLTILKINSMASHMNSILVVLFVLSLFFHFTNIYRDNQNRFLLNEPFSHRSLAGIYSSEHRVKAIDEVLMAIERYTDKNDYVLMANNLPMFYYLTGTKPALCNPWILLDNLEEIKRKEYDSLEKWHHPKLFVYAKVNTRDANWPYRDTAYLPSDKQKIDYLLNEYAGRLQYKPLWHNDVFIIYGNTHKSLIQ